MAHDVLGIAATLARSRAYLTLARALDAGLPLPAALRLAAAGNGSALAAAAGRVERGAALGDALEAADTGAMPTAELGLIRAGEASGTLPQLLRRLAARLDARVARRRHVLTGAIYPALLLHLAILAAAAPQLVAGLSAFLGTVVPRLLLLWLVGGAVWLFVGATTKREAGRRALTEAAARLPLVGPAVRTRAAAEYAQSLGLALGAGLPLRQSLELASVAAGWTPLEQAVRRISDALAEGISLTESHRRESVMPAELVESVAVGEQTGALDEMLERSGRMLDESATRRAEAIAKALPIVIYLAVALYVAFVVISGFGAILS